MALPLNEYLTAVIIIQLTIKLPLLAAWHTSFACPKEVSRKRHPTMPALRAPLCCSPVAGRQKLADAQTGLAPYSATGSAAQRHRMGNSTHARTYVPIQVGDIRKTLFIMSRDVVILADLSQGQPDKTDCRVNGHLFEATADKAGDDSLFLAGMINLPGIFRRWIRLIFLQLLFHRTDMPANLLHWPLSIQ
jgi:hypothetical protein